MSDSRAALFLDRDGILVEVVRRGAVISSARTWEEFQVRAGAAEVLRECAQLGYFTVLVTNQPDVARGLLSPQLLEEFHRELVRQIPLDALEVCPEDGHHPRRKPNPGMLLDAARAWNLDLSRSYMLGDSPKDAAAANAAGVQSILLRTDYNRDFAGPTLWIDRMEELPALLGTTRSVRGQP